MAFTNLLAPGQIGNLEIKNRIVMPGMGTHWASDDGFIGQRQIDYYAERAKGGVGLVIVEASCVQTPLGRGFQQISVDDDKYLPGLTALAKAIKDNGARAVIQLLHAGAGTTLMRTGGLTPVSPSGLHLKDYPESRALSIPEIKQIIEYYVQAAQRCYGAGFDAVEVHGAHQYLLEQFLSPLWNERQDDYGGNIKNRARLMTEIVSAIRTKIPGWPILCRLNGSEYGTREYFGRPSFTLDDAVEAAKLLEASGADAIHISAWGWGSQRRTVWPDIPGKLLPLAEAVKKAVSVPVISVGRMTPDVGERALTEGKADFIAMGRALIADPYLPRNLTKGQTDDITPCLTCLECLNQPRTIICAINARTGAEGKYAYPLAKALKPKTVLVIGGGPAGMEAARIAALRGHKVKLYEKESELGGKLLYVDKAPEKETMGRLNPYLKREIKRAGVMVNLAKEVTQELILSQKPDVVIVAAGAQPITPKIKGLEKANVFKALDVLAERVKVGKKVVVVGGGMVGLEVAEFLVARGKRVTICEMLAAIGSGVNPIILESCVRRLNEHAAEYHVRTTCKEITDRGVVSVDENGKERFFEADSIVLAAGFKANSKLFNDLKGKVPELYSIGDAVEARRIIHAIHEGFEAGYKI